MVGGVSPESGTTERRTEVNIGTRFLSSFQQSTTSALLGDTPLSDEESPLRAELFSTDQMAQHGKALADTHLLATGRAPDRLLTRLAANESVLVSVCDLLAAAVTEKRRIAPAGEWLLDNFYLIEEQIRTAKRHLPKGYSRDLPRLVSALSSAPGLPRVYVLALEVVAHGDGRIDAEVLNRFIAAYQSVTPLKLGELWATPIMLRLAIIENLRRVGGRIALSRADRDLANTWADQMSETAEKDPQGLILVIADMARSSPPLTSAFVAELARRLQGRGPALALPLTWIEQRLAASGLTIELLVQSENQQQAADQVSVSNSIGSLRLLGAVDWRDFVETQSVVEQALLGDPAGVYGAMDFATRDRYRHATEAIAKAGRLSEGEVARQAVALATVAKDTGSAGDPRQRHVGYYLIGEGLAQLEKIAQRRLSATQRVRRAAARYPLALYLTPIVLGSALLAAWLLGRALPAGVLAGLPVAASYVLQASLGVVLLLAASQLAAALANWLATLLVTPHALPRMDYSLGIPSSARTLVVVPTMLTSATGVGQLIEAMEVRFLANRDEHLHFGLLTDFGDADQPSLPADEALVRLAQAGIDELNEKYARPTGGDIFFLFHRPRRWNPQQGVWMGYERKRGKLAELNALLRSTAPGGDAGSEAFSHLAGDVSVLGDVRYVITLDTDTQLPRDAARQFVGAMAHPLNRPRYDAARGRVVDGYGILQPRVAISLPGTNRSRYARMYGGEPGIDPYTRAVSDVYQDLFGEGSFIGKGIYDVDTFIQVLGGPLTGRFPENQILSHDLLEGCYVRSGLLSDVQLFEDYPARYDADVSRRYRWIRGDWQVAGWLLRSVPGTAQDGRRQSNPLSALAQWKLFDNLRRSLVPAALILLLVFGWCAPAAPAWWTLAVLGVLLIPTLCGTLLEVFRPPAEVLLRQHLATVAHSVSRRFQQLSFELACLPHEAGYSLDAIARTWWRMGVSRRQLLEWNPSGEAELKAAAHGRSAMGDLIAAWRAMWQGPLIAVAVAGALVANRPAALAVATPILLLWLTSPWLAWWVSRPLKRHAATLTPGQSAFLRRLARRTWGFFDTFVGAEDHFLPPDNVQDYRAASIAHRTSPTNIGLALLANLAAYDFGYLPAGVLAQRTANTLHTLAGLERYRGHFYNWYNTQSLLPLAPFYVSSVDSGNLAGHLLTLRAGLLAVGDEAILGERLFDGLSDTLGVLRETLAAEPNAAVIAALGEFSSTLSGVSASAPHDPAAMRSLFSGLAAGAEKIVAALAVVDDVQLAGHGGHDGQSKRQDAGAWALALAGQCRAALDELDRLAPVALGRAGDALPSLRELAAAGNLAARGRIAELEALARLAGELAQMDYDFLFDRTSHLLAIGYNVAEQRVDTGFYDLLASEVRLGCFVAIAQGQLPQASWFALGRLLTATGGDPVLLSWSGSMFEYLMPLLVMPTYGGTLLDQTCKAAVARQIEYGSQRGVPWGISEAGYNSVDAQLNYQYRAFGVPGLGLKRGLAEDLVVAPYASALALMVAPEAACANLEKLAGKGFLGRFGFFEAIDYTAARQRRGQSHTAVRAFMAHHQGMSLLAIAYLLLNRPMQRRFTSDRLLQSVMLLLQERIPKVTALFSHTARLAETASRSLAEETPIRVLASPDTPVPEVQLLSNGRYHVMVTNGGGGYSRWKDLAVTRWREDGTCDSWGSFCYLRELSDDGEKNEVWSAAHQPSGKSAQRYEAIFSEGRAEFRRRDAVSSGAGASGEHFETHTEIVVSPEDDIELRRVRITNRSRQRRIVEVTSYAEVVIASPASDALHPAFSNLFVHTEILRERRAIIATRRPRSAGEASPWLLHLMAVHGAPSGQVSFETDRSRFIGRGRSTAAPLAMSGSDPLSDSDGSVLDPIVAIRHSVAIDAGASATVDIVSGMADSRELALGLIDRYQDRNLSDRVLDLSWTHSQVVLRQLNAGEADAQLYARLAASVIFANAGLRADAAVLVSNRRNQSGLWGYAISGDLPIVLLQITDAANIALVRQLVEAHAYWRLKGLAVDLVIWNEDHAGYRQQLQDQIIGLIASGIEASVIDRPGGIFVRPAEHISGEDRILFKSVARAVISDRRGTLAEQLDDRRLIEARPPQLKPTRALRAEPAFGEPTPAKDLMLTNGLGGFAADGREYVISLAPGAVTPAPWVNVLANANFGTVISESGMAYSWGENAHEFRLTPWHNDPVSDAGGEVLYLRDEESGHVWSPTPLPVRAATTYVVRHGFGYSVFETKSGGIRSELWVYVALDESVKFSVLKVRNESGRPRRLSATGYVEWVLGDLREKSAMHVTTEIAAQSGALYARNAYSSEFADRQAFYDVDDPARTLTGDRAEFIGRNGSLRDPAALRRTRLSGKIGAGLDPCAALQVRCDLADGQQREIIFRLGVGRNANDAGRLVQRFRGAVAARGALEAVRQYWQRTLGAVQVATPDPALNVLANGWLLYQTLACRIWARSGYYQSGGAFGFRDQLQDAMALIHADPALLRGQLLLCASRQFVEGDVQHWWHPPSGRGVRTHCSDDYLWLPLAVCRYLTATGDRALLDEAVPFLEGRAVNAEDDSYYDLPGRSAEQASVYQHCVRAIRHGLRFGAHGLPLIGSGDWNDGMNRVGVGGQGESVWLGFFLCEVLGQFAAVAAGQGDEAFAELCRSERLLLRQRIEENAWDGKWYRRAYFDDGSVLGSAGNDECRIDSIAQSWSVLSAGRGEFDRERSRLAMAAVSEQLVRRDDGLVQLLAPPFDHGALDPGYIRGYLPGIRENGGQYTHAAIWATMAFAALGDRQRAWELMDMINPVNHARSAAATATYKVEPYVVAADVYALAPHTGRGGWSWYTGSAGWMYRLITESLLGLRREADTLRFTPCLPDHWPSFAIDYRYRETIYHIVVAQADAGVDRLTLDGIVQASGALVLIDDRLAHRVEVMTACAP